jgi:hypothetical protein
MPRFSNPVRVPEAVSQAAVFPEVAGPAHRERPTTQELIVPLFNGRREGIQVDMDALAS